MPVMRNLMARPYGNWITYTRNFANEARCCPSRAAMLTGQYSHHHGLDGNGRWKFFDDKQTIATWLKEAGYRTGFIGKYFIGWPRGKRSPGWDLWERLRSTIDNDIAKAAGFIDSSTQSDEPFFLLMSFTAPHAVARPRRYTDITPWVPDDPPNYNEADVSDKPAVIRKLRLSPQLESKWRKERLNSQRELMMIDDGIQALLDQLNASGELDNTIVIFTADNGFSWGSHRYMYKHLPYEECSNVPTMIRWPGLGENRNESRLISNVDIAPTIVELAGARATRQMDGRSLASLVQSPNQHWHEAVLMQREKGKIVERFRGIRVPGWMYAEYGNGDRELYDLEQDPYEMTNLAGLPEYAAICSGLRDQMNALYRGDPRPERTEALTAVP